MRGWLLLLLVIPGFVLAKPGTTSGGKTGGLPASARPPAMQSTQTGHGGGRSQQREELRNPPPLDPKREITEQDCSRPVDLTKGNLKCK